MWAQTSISEQMNNIKMQVETYFHGEGCMPNQSDAMDVANQYLLSYLKSWMRKNYIDVSDDNIAQIKNHVQYLERRRGSMYLILAYIPITDLEGLFGLSLEQPETPVPPVYEPVPPVSYDPEPPVNTTPEPPVNIVPEPSVNTNIDNTTTNDNIADDGDMDWGLDEAIVTLTPLEEEMLRVTAEGIGPFIKKLESEYKLSRYGKYADMPADINCYLFVYDRTKTIVAYLRKEGDIYINLQNGTMDDIQNYKGCGAIWFRIKNY